jgi:hypothetical protein
VAVQFWLQNRNQKTIISVTSAEVKVNDSTSISHCYSKAGVAVQSIVEVCGKSAITGELYL